MTQPYRIPDPPPPAPKEPFKLKKYLENNPAALKMVSVLVIVVGFLVLESAGRVVFAFDPLTLDHGIPAGQVVVTVMAPFVGAIMLILTGSVLFVYVRLLLNCLQLLVR